MILIALGLIVSPYIERLWIKGVLAGLCTGMAVMEGIDVGAILSIYVGVFLIFWFLSIGPDPAKGARKLLFVGVVLVLSAVLIALSTIYTLVGTQIKGTASVGQAESEKRDAWDRNTQFSIPKLESLRVIIPGLFGYRLDMYTTSTNPSTYYWGRVAEDPHIEEMESNDPQERSTAAASLGLPEQVQSIMAGNDRTEQEGIIDKVKGMLQRRHTGNGEYAGVLVCLLAVFGAASALRKSGSPFSVCERRTVLFWGGAALFSLLAAWGRHGFVYSFIYQLPLTANFRNPQKYMHPFNISLMILSGCGLEALSRQYLTKPARTESFLTQILAWGKRVSSFEKRWAFGCLMILSAALVGWFILKGSQAKLVNHLLHNGFDETAAPQIARFCASQVGWFIIYLTLSGHFRGDEWFRPVLFLASS